MTDIKEKISRIRTNLENMGGKEFTFMEVCGTHTMSIAANGIRSLLPEGIRLISGPGCPVCVTAQGDIEAALILARKENLIITSFGDMIRVPAGTDRLENYRNVEISYSPMESLKIAIENPGKEVVFIGVGFETTTPLIAATIKEAKASNLKNFSVLSLHKTVPAALELILSDPGCRIDGLILPGHVAAVTGKDYFDFLKPYKTKGVISGFGALDVMECIYLLANMSGESPDNILNNYPSIVSDRGNVMAMTITNEVFEPVDSNWRGIGIIPLSGLKIKDDYESFDAKKKFQIETQEIPEPPGCLCGKILLGKSNPSQCSFFGKTCTPSLPIGPCMVSSEGTCAAWYKYNRGEE